MGIFVQTVQPNSIASGPNGLRCGDQILEFNGTNFRCVTAEQAAIEVARPAESVAILAQYNFGSKFCIILHKNCIATDLTSED